MSQVINVDFTITRFPVTEFLRFRIRDIIRNNTIKRIMLRRKRKINKKIKKIKQIKKICKDIEYTDKDIEDAYDTYIDCKKTDATYLISDSELLDMVKVNHYLNGGPSRHFWDMLNPVTIISKNRIQIMCESTLLTNWTYDKVCDFFSAKIWEPIDISVPNFTEFKKQFEHSKELFAIVRRKNTLNRYIVLQKEYDLARGY